MGASQYTAINFHKDIFMYLNKFCAVGEIYSLIIPICLPSDGGSLLWRTSQETNDKIFKYRVGMLAEWKGNLVHSIEPFTCKNETECRITFQIHVNLLPDKAIIFW